MECWAFLMPAAGGFLCALFLLPLVFLYFCSPGWGGGKSEVRSHRDVPSCLGRRECASRHCFFWKLISRFDILWYLVLLGKIIGIFLTLNYSFLLHFVFFLWLWKRLSRICQSAPIVWALQVFKNESWLFTVIQILGCLFISLNLPCVVGMQLLSQFFVLFFLAHFIFFPNFGILEFS